jgi:DNA-binding response OmpR family regulator
MSPGQRILVIEDDPSILLGLQMNLEADGFEVVTATDGDGGLEAARQQQWDLIILDIMLPGRNGYEIMCDLRSERIRTPILVLSARSSELDKVMGLDLGADDYVTKPFGVKELLARVRAMLRRFDGASEPTPWRFGSVEVDETTRTVTRDTAPVELTATEFSVLASLLRARGRILSREQIIQQVWGNEHYGTRRTVDNFVAQLRAKLEDDPAEPDHILTVRGVGYRLVTEPQ